MTSILLFITLVAILFSLGSSFTIVSTRGNVVSPRSTLSMGGNKAKFGIFSPAVIAAKYILGDAKLNKVILSNRSNPIF